MNPLSGYAQLLDSETITDASLYGYNATGTVLLTPEDSSFSGIHFVISNIVPSTSITSEPQYVEAGTAVASPDTARQISGQSLIHIEAYKVLEGVEYVIDPTQFLQPVLEPVVSTSFDCNDFVTYVGGIVVERKQVLPDEPELELVGPPLVAGIPGHEFPQPHDLVLRAEESMTSIDGLQLLQGSTFLMVGDIPVQFGGLALIQ